MTSESWVTVRSVDHERWYMARVRCTCGGHFRPSARRMAASSRGTGEIVVGCCDRCGTPRQFRFDVSPFYEREGRELRALGAALSTVDEETRRQILPRLGSPMTRTIGYVKQLCSEGDMLALEYLADAVRLALGKAQEGSRPADEDSVPRLIETATQARSA